ncbi:hypothetical protein A9404_06815 [Halothiobacillus diazotrophicus]|uniref:PglD N-terminal domain-containing protein n=1 Tax=Halothiobacillus diazotrophicus TaxID=1860122 RepID=A0A191ZGZ5_9GAMM|nr:acetyltransferase [Halothiobacillus diazotrophicus]ANJ67135.1 hypothetical protein A9404_06815 [Halothiobacillus diazotrophicus]
MSDSVTTGAVTNRPVVLLGYGGHARVVLDTLRALGAEVAGILAPDLPVGDRWEGIPVLGDDDWTRRPEAIQYHYSLGVGMLPQRPHLRQRLFSLLRERQLRMPPLVHPSAVLAPDVVLGEGTQVMAGVIVQPGSVIGENVLLNTRATVDHHCRIDAHVHVGPGAILCGEVQLGERVFVGAGATLIQGIDIGAGAQVAAGATVVRNIAAGIRHIPGHLPIRIEEA